ncbi:MAG: hypothetical protein AAF646_13780 [Pseudomonadota bacterium]
MKVGVNESAMRRVAAELRRLTYSEMITFSQEIAEALEVFELKLSDDPNDELTTEVIASRIDGWIHETLDTARGKP